MCIQLCTCNLFSLVPRDPLVAQLTLHHTHMNLEYDGWNKYICSHANISVMVGRVGRFSWRELMATLVESLCMFTVAQFVMDLGWYYCSDIKTREKICREAYQPLVLATETEAIDADNADVQNSGNDDKKQKLQ